MSDRYEVRECSRGWSVGRYDEGGNWEAVAAYDVESSAWERATALNRARHDADATPAPIGLRDEVAMMFARDLLAKGSCEDSPFILGTRSYRLADEFLKARDA